MTASDRPPLADAAIRAGMIYAMSPTRETYRFAIPISNQETRLCWPKTSYVERSRCRASGRQLLTAILKMDWVFGQDR